MAPDGNNSDQVKYMRTKSLSWSRSIRAGGIQKYESLHALKSTIPQTLKYPLTSMTLTRE